MAEVATNPSTMAESSNPVSTDPHKPTSSPKTFLDLPGELRNQVYRQYFDNFQEERKIEISFKKIASPYLNIIHANSKIRSEAASILYEEYLPTDSYENIDPKTQRPRPLMQCQIAQRIKDVFALVAIRDASLPMSIALSGALLCVHIIIKHIALQTQLPQPPSERDHVAWAIFLAYDQLDALLLSFHPHATCQAPVFKTRVW